MSEPGPHVEDIDVPDVPEWTDEDLAGEDVHPPVPGEDED